MYSATIKMGDELRHSTTTSKEAHRRTDKDNFYQAEDLHLSPGCIDISPCWFQQGREVCHMLPVAGHTAFVTHYSRQLESSRIDLLLRYLQLCKVIVANKSPC